MTEKKEFVNSLRVLNFLLPSSFLLYLLSISIISFSYQSYEPFLVINFFFFSFLLLIFFLSNKKDFDIFCASIFIFTVCLFWTSIAAVYFNALDDQQYLGQDSGFFLELSKGAVFINPIIFGTIYYDGIGAVNFWKLFYDLFSLMGFNKFPYIGITINTMLVSLSGLFSLKMVKLIYPSDTKRFYRYLFLFSSCGLFMLFASLHLRDAFVLFFVTLQGYGWIRIIRYPNLTNFILLLLISFISAYALLWLRTEFTALGFAFLVAFLASFIITNKWSRSVQFLIYSFSASAVVLLLILMSSYTSVISDLLDSTSLYTKEMAQASGDSLGYDLILSQPLPIRLILSSLFIFIMPIPFWSGMEVNSIYFFLKSLNALYFYFVIPLLILSFLNFSSFKGLRNNTNFFLLFCMLGFTVVVAATSIEGRHIGSFLPLFLLFSLIPSFSSTLERKNYRTILLAFMSMMLLVHTLWIFIKYL
jgi:hypothetical protein